MADKIDYETKYLLVFQCHNVVKIVYLHRVRRLHEQGPLLTVFYVLRNCTELNYLVKLIKDRHGRSVLFYLLGVNLVLSLKATVAIHRWLLELILHHLQRHLFSLLFLATAPLVRVIGACAG